jgi:nucleoside-diphosphate-sugar epimerase
MKLLITGGGGFVGTRLARTLLASGTLAGRKIERLVLADMVAPQEDLRADPRVQARTGSLLELCGSLGEEAFDGVFHLAAAVSAECEADFDLGLKSNLDTTRALLETLRARYRSGDTPPRFVFASSMAVFGSDPAVPLPDVVRDDTLPTPQTSYGIQKFICEQLVADYTRKGYLDGRSARLMTVTVRPGKPNRAASGFLSGIVREPLAGHDAICPVPPDTLAAVGSPAHTIRSLIAIYEASRETFGGRTAINLPALTVSVQQMLDALEAVAGKDVRAQVRFEHDETTARMVCGWPARIESERAARLGLRADADFRSIVEQYVHDHPQAVTVATRSDA